MRYVFICHLKTMEASSKEIWYPVIMYPKENTYIDEQVDLTKSFMKNPETLMKTYTNDYIKELRDWHEDLSSWLADMYEFGL